MIDQKTKQIYSYTKIPCYHIITSNKNYSKKLNTNNLNFNIKKDDVFNNFLFKLFSFS